MVRMSVLLLAALTLLTGVNVAGAEVQPECENVSMYQLQPGWIQVTGGYGDVNCARPTVENARVVMATLDGQELVVVDYVDGTYGILADRDITGEWVRVELQPVDPESDYGLVDPNTTFYSWTQLASDYRLGWSNSPDGSIVLSAPTGGYHQFCVRLDTTPGDMIVVQTENAQWAYLLLGNVWYVDEYDQNPYVAVFSASVGEMAWFCAGSYDTAMPMVIRPR